MRHNGSRWLLGSVLALAVLQAAAFAFDRIPADQRTGSPLQDFFLAAWLICR